MRSRGKRMEHRKDQPMCLIEQKNREKHSPRHPRNQGSIPRNSAVSAPADVRAISIFVPKRQWSCRSAIPARKGQDEKEQIDVLAVDIRRGHLLFVERECPMKQSCPRPAAALCRRAQRAL